MDRIEKLKQFLSLTPDDPFLLHALGLEYRKIGEDAMALKWFEQALAKDMNYVGTYHQLGLYWIEKGEPSKAISYLEKGLAAARKKEDRHAQREISGLLEELQD